MRSGRPEAGEDRKRALAVALTYDWGNDNLPRVSASGRGALAERILEIAFARGVKVRTDADLVELLAAVEVEQEIPVEAILAVAEIMAQVYRANAEAARKHDSRQGSIEKDAPQAWPREDEER